MFWNDQCGRNVKLSFPLCGLFTVIGSLRWQQTVGGELPIVVGIIVWVFSCFVCLLVESKVSSSSVTTSLLLSVGLGIKLSHTSSVVLPKRPCWMSLSVCSWMHVCCVVGFKMYEKKKRLVQVMCFSYVCLVCQVCGTLPSVWHLESPLCIWRHEDSVCQAEGLGNVP